MVVSSRVLHMNSEVRARKDKDTFVHVATCGV
jgi:hypothetical protein